MLANRLRRNQRHLRKWARRNGITLYRLYERDIPEHPLILDWYDGRVVVYALRRKRDETEEARAAWLAEAESEILEGLEIPREALFFKTRERQSGKSQYQRLAHEATEFIVQENGHSFIVNLSDFLDTGLFLDHRNLRKTVEGEAAGKDFLNLFAYTGSFSVYAAKGGARSTTTVDISNTYLDWAERNFALNGLDPATNSTERADVLSWLKEAKSARRMFDLIVCDPPTFSNSKKMTQSFFDVSAHHPDLINGSLSLLRPGGTLYFSTNHRGFEMKANALDPCEMEEISAQTVPEDFRNKRIHRSWKISPSTTQERY